MYVVVCACVCVLVCACVCVLVCACVCVLVCVCVFLCVLVCVFLCVLVYLNVMCQWVKERYSRYVHVSITSDPISVHSSYICLSVCLCVCLQVWDVIGRTIVVDGVEDDYSPAYKSTVRLDIR